MTSPARAATHTFEIFKGARPGDIPVEPPTKFTIVVNLKTARALDTTIPRHSFFEATE